MCVFFLYDFVCNLLSWSLSIKNQKIVKSHLLHFHEWICEVLYLSSVPVLSHLIIIHISSTFLSTDMEHVPFNKHELLQLFVYVIQHMLVILVNKWIICHSGHNIDCYKKIRLILIRCLQIQWMLIYSLIIIIIISFLGSDGYMLDISKLVMVSFCSSLTFLIFLANFLYL